MTTIRIMVVHEHGGEAAVDLTLPLSFREGFRLNRISDGSGVDHFFTKDGHYDGWGASVASPSAGEPTP